MTTGPAARNRSARGAARVLRHEPGHDPREPAVQAAAAKLGG